MISRIRLEALGASADEVERTLYPHADEIEKLLGVGVSRGECVIERDVAEPSDSPFAFKGRLLLHPAISAPAVPWVELTGAKGASSSGGTGGIPLNTGFLPADHRLV